jgi:hypothetical protein
MRTLVPHLERSASNDRLSATAQLRAFEGTADISRSLKTGSVPRLGIHYLPLSRSPLPAAVESVAISSELQRHRHEARRLRAQYSHDRALHAALALDLAIRTAACRMLALGCAVASRLFGSEGRRKRCHSSR